MDQGHLLGVFLDFENLALGFRGRQQRFDIERVLARLVEKGHIVVKRAYADWKRYGTYVQALHEAAIELIEIPARGLTGKNSADIRLCVDVMDLCYAKSHIDTFVILSGDSDFSPLVSKLKENGKTVIGLGVKESVSDLLRDNCDEFIYYEDLEADAQSVSVDLSDTSEKERELFTLLLEAIQALRRAGRDVFYPSLIKETMRRKKPSFTETYYGFKSFGALLEVAAARGLVTLERDEASRTHIVTAVGEEAAGEGGQPKRKTTSMRKRRRSSKKKA